MTNFASQAEADVRGLYFFVLAGGTGTFTTPWHFPSTVLLPIKRPEASRWVPEKDPERLSWVVWLPVSRPEESR